MLPSEAIKNVLCSLTPRSHDEMLLQGTIGMANPFP